MKVDDDGDDDEAKGAADNDLKEGEARSRSAEGQSLPCECYICTAPTKEEVNVNYVV